MTIAITDDPSTFPTSVRGPSTGDLFGTIRSVFGQDLANRTAWLKRLATSLGVPRLRFGTAAAMVALTGNSDGDIFLVTSNTSPVGMGLYVFDSSLSQSAGILTSPPFVINATAGGGAWKHSLLGMLGAYLPYSGSDGRVPAALLEICTANVDAANRVPAAQVKNGLVYANGQANLPAVNTTASSTIATFTIPNLQVGDIILVDCSGNVSKSANTESATIITRIAATAVGNALFSASSGGNTDSSTLRAMACVGYGTVAAAGSVTVDAIIQSGSGVQVGVSSGSLRVLVFRP